MVQFFFVYLELELGYQIIGLWRRRLFRWPLNIVNIKSRGCLHPGVTLQFRYAGPLEVGTRLATIRSFITPVPMPSPVMIIASFLVIPGPSPSFAPVLVLFIAMS